jgi:hypothetical protein
MRSAGGAAGDGFVGSGQGRKDGQITTSRRSNHDVHSQIKHVAACEQSRRSHAVPRDSPRLCNKYSLFYCISTQVYRSCSNTYVRCLRSTSTSGVTQSVNCGAAADRHEWVDWNSRITGGGHASRAGPRAHSPSFSDSFFVLLQGIGTHPVPLCLCSHSRIFKNTLLVITMKKNRLPWSHAKVLYPIRPPTALIPSGFGARPSCLATCAGIDRLRAVAVAVQ